jgi:hypothetical protein
MKQYFLSRISMTGKETFGVLMDDKIPFAVTLEPPENGNRTKVSCIPEGSYICERIISSKYGNTFEVTDVNHRSNILFHWGNWVKDTEGCILLGTFYDILNDKPAIAISKKAFRKFLYRLKDVDEFALTIIDSWAVVHGNNKTT